MVVNREVLRTGRLVAIVLVGLAGSSCAWSEPGGGPGLGDPDASMASDASSFSDASTSTDASVASRLDYPACRDAGAVGTSCPGEPEELCRLEAIRASYATGCAVDADCAKATAAYNCLDWGSCEPRPSVLVGNLAAFSAAVALELEEYCRPINCGHSDSCVLTLQTRSVCRAGACVTERE